MKPFCTALFSIVIGGASAQASSYTFTTLNVTGVQLFDSGGINDQGVVGSYTGSQLYTWDGTTYRYYTPKKDGDAAAISLAPQAVSGIDSNGNFAYTHVNPDGQSSIGVIYNVNTLDSQYFTYPAADFTILTGISSNGWIAGYRACQVSICPQTGFVEKSPTGFVNITYPAGRSGAQRYVFDVNDSGHAVGNSECCNQGVGFLFNNGTYTTISVAGVSDSLITPFGLNDLDQVVGSYSVGSIAHGFIWSDGSGITLDVPGATSTVLRDINSSGEIFGHYQNANGVFAFVATPVSGDAPEPGTLGLIGSGLALAAWGRRRR